MDNGFFVLNDLCLRNTLEEDLCFVLEAENNYENKAYILPWDYDQQRVSLIDEDKKHLIIENAHKYRIGYVILAGLKNRHNSIELVRIVITSKGKGYGKKTIRALQEYIFCHLKAHRLWLDVKVNNFTARHTYVSTGFVEEGILRECIKSEDEYESLVLMSILSEEYFKQETEEQS